MFNEENKALNNARVAIENACRALEDIDFFSSDHFESFISEASKARKELIGAVSARERLEMLDSFLKKNGVSGDIPFSDHVTARFITDDELHVSLVFLTNNLQKSADIAITNAINSVCIKYGIDLPMSHIEEACNEKRLKEAIEFLKGKKHAVARKKAVELAETIFKATDY